MNDRNVSPRKTANRGEAEAVEGPERIVRLREERRGDDSRNLWAYVDEEGSLHIDGQDLGPGTAPVSPDGEYEWFTTVRREDVADLVAALGGRAEEDVLDLLAERFSGEDSYELERVVRESGVPFERFVC